MYSITLRLFIARQVSFFCPPLQSYPEPPVMHYYGRLANVFAAAVSLLFIINLALLRRLPLPGRGARATHFCTTTPILFCFLMPFSAAGLVNGDGCFSVVCSSVARSDFLN